MMIDLLTDLFTALHMFCFAAGIGMSLFVEGHLLPKFFSRVEAADLRTLLAAHRMIETAVVGLWVSGVAIMWMKLGVQGQEPSAKLAMKFFVVGLLTVNMKLIATCVLPILQAAQDRALADLSIAQLRQLGAIGGMSTACWLMGLGLGAIGVFKTLSALHLVALFLPALVAAPLLGAIIAPRVVHSFASRVAEPT